MHYLTVTETGEYIDATSECIELEDNAALVAELRKRGLSMEDRAELYEAQYLRVDHIKEHKVVRYTLESDDDYDIPPNAGSAS